MTKDQEIDFRVAPAHQLRAAMHVAAAQDAIDAYKGLIGSLCNQGGQNIGGVEASLEALKSHTISELDLAAAVAARAARQVSEAADE